MPCGPRKKRSALARLPQELLAMVGEYLTPHGVLVLDAASPLPYYTWACALSARWGDRARSGSKFPAMKRACTSLLALEQTLDRRTARRMYEVRQLYLRLSVRGSVVRTSVGPRAALRCARARCAFVQRLCLDLDLQARRRVAEAGRQRASERQLKFETSRRVRTDQVLAKRTSSKDDAFLSSARATVRRFDRRRPVTARPASRSSRMPY